MLQPRHFRLQVSAPRRGQPVSLPAARAVLFLKTLDPLILKQAAQRPVQSTGAEPHAPVAHPLGVLEDRIAVAGLFGKAQKDEQDRLANLHICPPTTCRLTPYCMILGRRSSEKCNRF